jgi:catechol 2,3-dioxygenase
MTVHELGHIVLYVSDLERSRRFYGSVLGWKELGAPPGMPACAFSSGRTHHELLLIEVGRGAEPVPDGRHLGLYHFGLKVGTTDAELKAVLDKLKAERVEVVGATDHGVTHSLYIKDPDGNEIELYIDVQPEDWRSNPDAFFARPRALRL